MSIRDGVGEFSPCKSSLRSLRISANSALTLVVRIFNAEIAEKTSNPAKTIFSYFAGKTA